MMQSNIQWYYMQNCNDSVSNSLRPDDTCMHHWTGLSLVQEVMAWRWTGDKPLPADLLSIGPLVTNLSQIRIQIENFSFMKMHLKLSSAKWQPFCISLNVFTKSRCTHKWHPIPAVGFPLGGFSRKLTSYNDITLYQIYIETVPISLTHLLTSSWVKQIMCPNLTWKNKTQ